MHRGARPVREIGLVVEKSSKQTVAIGKISWRFVRLWEI
jgi:hypothetical protein